MPLEIVEAVSPDTLDAVRALMHAHAAALTAHPGAEAVALDADRLPGPYGPPRGRLYLARIHGRPAGCVALHPLSETVAEVKRMFVLATTRRGGVGRALMTRLLADARGLGYRTIRLGTLEEMTAARALYLSLGFHPIPRYHREPTVDQVFFELTLPAPD